MPCIATVEHIVLNDEENVKTDRRKSQTKFCEIARNRAPIVAVVGVEKNLAHAQEPTSEVQQYVAYAPARGAFALEIEQCLRHVLEQRDKHLDVGAAREELQPPNHVAERHAQAQDQEHCDALEEPPAHHRDRLVPSFVDEALEARDETRKQRVRREQEVVQLHRDVAVGMVHEILLLDRAEGVQTQVEHEVQAEARDVQGQEIKAE